MARFVLFIYLLLAFILVLGVANKKSFEPKDYVQSIEKERDSLLNLSKAQEEELMRMYDHAHRVRFIMGIDTTKKVMYEWR
jgi:hypothetical protein